MTNDLVKRLRANASWGYDIPAEAADRIEELEAALSDLIEEAYEAIPQHYIEKAYSVLTGDKKR